MKFEEALYIEPSADDDTKSLTYVRGLFKSAIKSKRDIIVSDPAGKLIDAFKQIEQEVYPDKSVYEKIALNINAFVNTSLIEAEHDILEVIQPRYREQGEAKVVFVNSGSKNICAFVLGCFNNDVEKGNTN